MLVQDFLINSAERFPNKIALVCGEQRYTYAELLDMSRRLSAALISIGLQRQDRVVIFCENSAEPVVSLFATLMAGGIFVILNPAMKYRKLSYALLNSGARIIIAQTSKAAIVGEALVSNTAISHVIWVGDVNIPISGSVTSYFWDYLLSEANQTRYTETPRSIDVDLATIIYTSGSTGEPKGVTSAHYNMIASARSISSYLENSPDDIILSTLALSYGYGLYQILTTFLVGAKIILEPSFTFPYKVFQLISEERVTGIPIVPTIAARLLSLNDLRQFKLRSLRYITNAAAALPLPYIRKLREHFPQVKIFSMYGLTECTRVSYLPPAEIERRPASVGVPMPNCEVFIVDEEGQRLEVSHVGELVVRGSNVNQGYWNLPEETFRQFRPGGSRGDVLLYTGDLFKQDEDGFLYFVSRKDDLIKTRGERVSPKEIEDVIFEINGVAQTAVVGLPDEIFGQAIMAFVVLSAGSYLKKVEIINYCKKNLEPFMVPKLIEFRDFLPITPNGKIDKKLLMQEVISPTKKL